MGLETFNQTFIYFLQSASPENFDTAPHHAMHLLPLETPFLNVNLHPCPLKCKNSMSLCNIVAHGTYYIPSRYMDLIVPPIKDNE